MMEVYQGSQKHPNGMTVEDKLLKALKSKYWNKYSIIGKNW